jgi:hypothetical protein
MTRWAPVAAAAGVVVVLGAAVAVVATHGGGSTQSAAAAPSATPTPALAGLRVRDGDLVTAAGTVLAAPGKPVRFCAPTASALPGIPGPEQPPGCSPAVTLVGADVSRLADQKAYRGTRWGQARITGRYGHGTITVTDQGVRGTEPAMPETSRPFTPPCPAPTGGWQPGLLGRSGLDALDSVIQHHPGTYGDVSVTYPGGLPAGITTSPLPAGTTQVAMVTTTLDPATAETALRVHYAGNLCVVRTRHSRADTDAVWRKLSPENGTGDLWRRYGVFQGGPDYFAGQARIMLMVLDDAAYRWLDGVGGAMVEAQPWLRRVG